MPRLFSSEGSVSGVQSSAGGIRAGSVSGYQSNGPEMRADAGSPHAASPGGGAAPVGGQYPQVSPLNTGGNSFLQHAQMKKGGKPSAPEEKGPVGEMRDTSLDPGPAMLPPGGGTGTQSASGASPGGASSGWTWTAKAGSAAPNTPSYGGAAYNGGGPLASGMSNPNAPRAAIGNGKIVQGTVEP